MLKCAGVLFCVQGLFHQTKKKGSRFGKLCPGGDMSRLPTCVLFACYCHVVDQPPSVCCMYTVVFAVKSTLDLASVWWSQFFVSVFVGELAHRLPLLHVTGCIRKACVNTTCDVRHVSPQAIFWFPLDSTFALSLCAAKLACLSINVNVCFDSCALNKVTDVRLAFRSTAPLLAYERQTLQDFHAAGVTNCVT